MGFGGVALTNMRSSAVCGVEGFVAISLPRCLGSAPRLLGRVRLLPRLGSCERSGRTFGVGPSAVSSACSQTLVVVIYVYPKDAPMYPHVRMRYGYVLRYGELKFRILYVPHQYIMVVLVCFYVVSLV